MKSVFLVGIGGFFGASLRYCVYLLQSWLLPAFAFPLATLAVNLLGCLAIGFAAGCLEVSNAAEAEKIRLFIIVGALGGFTTYSAFGWDALVLLRQSEYLKMSIYIGLHLLLGIGAVVVGFKCSPA